MMGVVVRMEEVGAVYEAIKSIVTEGGEQVGWSPEKAAIVTTIAVFATARVMRMGMPLVLQKIADKQVEEFVAQLRPEKLDG